MVRYCEVHSRAWKIVERICRKKALFTLKFFDKKVYLCKECYLKILRDFKGSKKLYRYVLKNTKPLTEKARKMLFVEAL